MKTIEEKAKRYDELSKEVLDYFNGKTKMFSDTADDDYPGRPFIDEVRNICNNAIKD